MANESIGLGPEDLRHAKRKVVAWGTACAVLAAALVYSLFFGLVPAVKEYNAIREKLCMQVVHRDGSRSDKGCVERERPQQRAGLSFALPSAHAVVTTVGKGFLVDAWQNIVEMEIMKFHGVGTGTNAAAAGDTALQTEITTQINPDSTRATGSLTEGASANIFRTVGTVSFDGSAAVTEWGLFSQAATGGGTMFSRIVFSAINVSNGDSIQFTYDLTVN